MQLAALLQIASDDEQQLIAVDQGPRVIDHQHAIGIAIESDTQVGLLGHDLRLQLRHMSRATLVIDIQPIGMGR
ncbi:hypothetical protein D9M68_965820 [compost metagenome]